ncbi:hypothetical protein A1O7_09709 [Cladophialophora yegresii CBS 114405]|uniref:Transcription factor domain-containing protein n=1 Tax=Cladophialophora yegresii CBS 114405 TaxID=1182544 RepID=W9VN05_9EURO|nr:uncharacterized protein A1O7_09709 [Cladophialophora yegresii CBS 114405]EXJ54370.1 hypothetical protein A1O7_09709 [Cladophialophora yegresii CBS 114405]
MSRSSSEGDQSLSTSPSPRSDPSGGLFDPFDVLNVSSNGARSSMSTVGQSQMMFRTAIIEQWPSFALSSRAQDIETWRTATVTLALQHAYLASAIIYAGSSYQYFFGARDPASNFVRMTAYNDTLRQVRKAIEALVDDGCTGATPDARAKADTVVLAVALLAIHGPPVDMQGSTLVGPQQMKDYEYYGSRTWEPTHLHALLCLTKQRGGLQHVGMQSLAGMILTIDLVDSLLTLRQPTFPLFFPPGPLLQSLRTIAPLPGTVCQGFRFLRNRRHGQRFVSITQDVHALLNAYSMVLQDPAVGIDFGQLVATWRLLQHQALTVATGGDLLFNLCRAAVVVFLAECLEPLPVVGAFHRNSSRSLMLLIDECDKRDCWLSCPDLLLWASILGGYVSRGSALRPWYIQQLRSSPVAVQKERWGEVLRLGDGFLPFRHRQADGCFGFWREACEWLTPSSFLDS